MDTKSDIPDIERQYNSRLAVAGHEAFSDEWDRQSAAYRSEADADLDIAYGPSARNGYDFFRGQGADGGEPVCAYIHGGYWRSRDRKTFSHIAKALNDRGVSVAVPSYDLCPDVTVLQIIDQMRAFLAALWAKTQRRPVVAGHSAGGHLTAAMVATDWSVIEGVPGDLVRAGYGISGIYDLRPLCQVSVNEDLKLTEDTAAEVSPLLWPAPSRGMVYAAAVGAEESVAFRQQSRMLADRWAEAGVATEYSEVPDCHHFSIVDALTAPESAMTARIADLAHGSD